jgi:hypothetical protein
VVEFLPAAAQPPELALEPALEQVLRVRHLRASYR